MRAVTNPSFLIHHQPSVVICSLCRCIPLFSLSDVKIQALSTFTSDAQLDNTRTDRSGSLSSPPAHFDVPQKIDVNPPKGTRDFHPEEMPLRNWLFQNFRELYCFEDCGNSRVALRPELTPSLARLVIQKGKICFPSIEMVCIGQCWRYERMTRGRRREHYQGNMDIIGVPNVAVLQEVLRRYSIPENLFGTICVIIDKLEKIPVNDIKKELRSVELSEEAVEELLEILSVKCLTKLEEKLGASVEAFADLKQLFSLAEKVRLLRVDPV